MRPNEHNQRVKERARAADRYLKTHNYEAYQKNGQRYAIHKTLKPGHCNDGQKTREVFIGRLPRDMFEDELMPVMQMVGPVQMMRLMMDFSGSNRGFAFVKYCSPKDAYMACKRLNEYAVRKEEAPIGVALSFDNKQLFLGNLPIKLSEAKLQQELNRVIGGIESIELSECLPQATERNAYVTFETHDAATQARRILCPGDIEICDRIISVEWARPVKPELEENLLEALISPLTIHSPKHQHQQQPHPKGRNSNNSTGSCSGANSSSGSDSGGSPVRQPQHHQASAPQQASFRPPARRRVGGDPKPQLHNHQPQRRNTISNRPQQQHQHHQHHQQQQPYHQQQYHQQMSMDRPDRRTPLNRVLLCDANNNSINCALPHSPLISIEPAQVYSRPFINDCILGDKARQLLAACPPDPQCTTIIDNINLALVDRTRLRPLFEMMENFKVTNIVPCEPATLEVSYEQPEAARIMTELLNRFPGNFQRLAMPGTKLVARQVYYKL